MCFLPPLPLLTAFLSGKYFYHCTSCIKMKTNDLFILEVVCSFVISGFSGARRH